MPKRDFVILTREFEEGREEIARLPFTSELCTSISKECEGSPKFDTLTPLEVAIKLGSGGRVYVKSDRVYSYKLIED